MLVAFFVTVGGAAVLASFEQTPRYLRAARASTVGPQAADIFFPGRRPPAGSAAAVASLRALPGVRAVIPVRDLEVRDCTTVYGGGADICTAAFVGTCADLTRLTGVLGCRDDQVAFLDYPSFDESSRVTGGFRLHAGGRRGHGGVVVPAPTARLAVRAAPEDPNWLRFWSVFVPTGTPGVRQILPPVTQWTAVLDGGPAVRARFLAAAHDRLPTADARAEDLSDLAVVGGYRTILWTASGAALLVGLAALLISAVDRAFERRRQVAALRALGVPGGVIGRSQLLQTLLPLLVGLPTAAVMGLLAGSAYLNLAEERDATPWTVVVAATGVALLGAVVVSAATVPALGRRLTPELLSRE